MDGMAGSQDDMNFISSKMFRDDKHVDLYSK